MTRWSAAFLYAITACAAAATYAAPAALKTAPVTRGDVATIVTAAGTMEPVGVVDVGPQVAGAVVTIGAHTDFMDEVEAGALLVQLDDKFLKARLDRELAGLKRLQAEAERTRLQARDAAPVAQPVASASVDAADAAVEEAKASVREAQLSLEAARITAPLKGIVIDRHVEPGEAVGPNLNGGGLYLLWPADYAMRVRAMVGETAVVAIRAGESVEIHCDALPGRALSGTVAKVQVNAVNEKGVVMFPVEIDVRKPDFRLLPYLTAEVRIDTGIHKNVLRVPTAALEWLPQSELLAAMRRQTNPAAVAAEAARKKSPRVWVQDGGAVRAVEVQLGASDGQFTELTAGAMKEGDAVIVEGAAP